MAMRFSDPSEVLMTILTPVPSVELDPYLAFEDEVARLRAAAFDLTDTAKQVLGHGFTGVHVHLQTAANELGELQRLLVESRRSLRAAGCSAGSESGSAAGCSPVGCSPAAACSSPAGCSS